MEKLKKILQRFPVYLFMITKKQQADVGVSVNAPFFTSIQIIHGVFVFNPKS